MPDIMLSEAQSKAARAQVVNLSESGGVIDGVFARMTQITPLPRLYNPATTPPPAPAGNTVTSPNSDTEKSGPDPVLQALLQQLEHTKPGVTTIPASQASKVTVLPGSQASGAGSVTVLVLLAVVGVGAWYFHKKKSKKGGAQKVESDH